MPGSFNAMESYTFTFLVYSNKLTIDRSREMFYPEKLNPSTACL